MIFFERIADHNYGVNFDGKRKNQQTDKGAF